ncbi:hypothetical protein ONE63_008536 [Megalurothrips usitatus]|uniref:3'-5' exonuclease domain-containing protein n=1 Tax=Megalurothrips usitatus TaxID=439358 RepID=A0AAV7XLH0_9NEOP|nr:hypothetical protein ONE63_008536 [Megalurothrips usitatus]
MSSNNVHGQFTKGQKLFVTLVDDRNFEGTFSRQSEARNSIVFYNISFVPDGKNFEQLEFKLSEIFKIASLEGEEIGEDVDDGRCMDDSVQKFCGALYEKVKECVEQHVFIDQTDENFADAIRVLDSTDTVAVTAEGSNQGRFGYITVLCIAVHNSVFLFDIMNLGMRAFKAAGSFLKKLLESKRVLKVTHNCRFLSDCLKHKYEITLQNVFDTQACHSVITNNRGCSVRLSELVSEYLKLPGNICEEQVTDSSLWRQRPLEPQLVLAAAWRVALIRKLKSPLDDALYAPFDKMCQLYLTSVRDIDDALEAKIAVVCILFIFLR